MIVLNVILESLLKWFAPILVFTTDEIFSLINKDEKNIHEYLFVNIPKNWESRKLSEKWEQLFKIKQEANIAIEEKRTNKEIGSSLEAEIKLIVDNKKYELLKNLDLAEYFITSKAEKFLSKDGQTKIEVKKQKAINVKMLEILEQKCKRCSALV